MMQDVFDKNVEGKNTLLVRRVETWHLCQRSTSMLLFIESVPVKEEEKNI